MYYAYPAVSYIPEQTVYSRDGGVDGSVSVFRVDVDRTEREGTTSQVVYSLAKIDVNERGQIPSQLEVYPVTGLYNPFQLTSNVKHEQSHYSMTLRLYRLGYQMQEVHSWERSRPVYWVAANDLAAREKAVDDLLATPTTPGQDVKGTWWDQRNEKTPPLQPGLIEQRLHRDALIFAARQYEILVDSPEASAPTVQPIRDRMRSKAQYLRTYADRQPPAEPR
jgi:hypothetical protein